MEWVLQHFPRKAVLLARIVGDYEPEGAGTFLQSLGLAWQQHSPQVLLIDRRRSALKFSTVNIYTHPEDYRQAGIIPPATIALIVSEITLHERFLENVFLNQWYKMKTFDDWRRAVVWARDSRRPV